MRRVVFHMSSFYLAVLVVSGCSTFSVGPTAERAGSGRPTGIEPFCSPIAGEELAPASGVLAGVNLHWGAETLQEYAARLGARPAVAVSFSPLPLSAQDEENVTAAKDQARQNGGVLLLTLEPHEGLPVVTAAAADDLAILLDGYNREGVPVIVRFAHEMNGSWYPWGQQPQEYRAAFRRIADALRRPAPGSATMWAPNYGGGYPFAGGESQALPGSVSYQRLDTNHDGDVDGEDDPYGPYYSGDDAVDWVGMSLYHWGNTHSWGGNEIPEPDKFLDHSPGAIEAKVVTTPLCRIFTPSAGRPDRSRSPLRRRPRSMFPAVEAETNSRSSRPGGANCSIRSCTKTSRK